MEEFEAWESLTYEEKNRYLYLKQKRMLEQFLERNAISEEQYKKSLFDMTNKMRIAGLGNLETKHRNC